MADDGHTWGEWKEIGTNWFQKVCLECKSELHSYIKDDNVQDNVQVLPGQCYERRIYNETALRAERYHARLYKRITGKDISMMGWRKNDG